MDGENLDIYSRVKAYNSVLARVAHARRDVRFHCSLAWRKRRWHGRKRLDEVRGPGGKDSAIVARGLCSLARRVLFRRQHRWHVDVPCGDWLADCVAQSSMLEAIRLENGRHDYRNFF